MAAFTYKAVDSSGSIQTGTLDAAHLEDVAAILQRQKLFLMEARAVPLPSSREEPVSASSTSSPSSVKVSLEGVAIFTNELAIMLRTGLPLSEALHSLSRQQNHAGFKRVLTEIFQDVQRGQSLSDAFRKFPTVFDPVYVTLLQAGETGGDVPQVLSRVSSYLNFQRGLKEKIRSALLYPAIVVSTGIAVVAFLVVAILPVFATIFSELNTELPLPTRVLLSISGYVRHEGWMVLLVAGGAAWGFRWWLKRPDHRYAVDVLKLRVPIVGTMIRNVVLTRTLRTLSALVANSVPILNALQLARDSANQAVFESIFDRVQDETSQGKGLATALYKNPFFPQSAAHMIANAELTGTLPEVLTGIAEYYEHETDISIRNMFAVLEPLFVIGLGLAVGLVAISILWPMFRLNGSI